MTERPANRSADPRDHEPPSGAGRHDPDVAAYWLARIRAQLHHEPEPEGGPPPPPGQLHLDDA
jgi:hypothetical protein